MQDAKEEVRTRLAIEDVIGEYVELKRAGRNFKGLSPFTDERTPSFVVSPDKSIWHDFSSNKGGDVFSFVMEVEGIDFRMALEQLAKKANVDLTQYQSAQAGDFAKRKKRLLEALSLTAKFYQRSMIASPAAQAYIFQTRGLTKDTVQAFQIGYAPDEGNTLTNFLLERKFSKSELIAAGLVNRYGGDLFRGRMMVPLMDASGQVIGFTGRIIGDVPNAPKYLNTPATLLYDKSRHVFGLSQAKQAIRDAGRAVLVEGNLDVIASYQAGVKNVVATAGTALTEEHLRTLSRLADDLRLGFDGDKAGVAAAERAIGIASRLGLNLSIVSIPPETGAKDPDELIKQSTALWRQAIDDAEPAVEWLFKQFSSRLDMTTANGKRIFSTAALGVVDRITDPVEKDYYEQKVASLVGVSADSIRQKLATLNTEETRTKKQSHAQKIPAKKMDSDETRQDAVLGIAAMTPSVRELFRDVDLTIFDGDDRRRLAAVMARHYTTDGPIDTLSELRESEMYVKIATLKAETRYANWDTQQRYFEAAELLRHVKIEHRKKQKETLQEELRVAEQQGSADEVAKLLGQITQLNKEISRGR